MSCHCPRHSECSTSLFDDALNFELGLGRSGQRGAKMEQCHLVWRALVESRFHERKGCASQNAVDQKEIAETIGMKSLDPPPFQYLAHCNNSPALFGALPAREELEHNKFLASSKFDSAPHYYGGSFPKRNRFATGARAA